MGSLGFTEQDLTSEDAFWLGDILVDRRDSSVHHAEQRIPLSDRALSLLLVLVRNQGIAVERERLMQMCSDATPISNRTLTQLVAELRSALHDDSHHPRYIETCPRRGYRLLEEVVIRPAVLLPVQEWQGVVMQLRSSRIIRVSAGFFIVAWLLLQVVAVLFPMLELPDIAYKVVVLSLTVLLPTILYTTWIREIRIRRRNLQHNAGEHTRYRRQLGLEALVILTLTSLAFLLGGHVLSKLDAEPQPMVSAPVIDPSTVAVLPFVSRVDDRVPSYFVGGVQEELITTLSAADSLRVASMRATRGIASALSLVQLRDRLRVQYVIEGGVSRIDEELVVVVHISDTENGYRVWQQEFRGDDKRLLVLSSQIARQIWLAMGLLLPELHLEGEGPLFTEDVVAYDNYLLAKDLLRDRPTESRLLKAEELLLRALGRDPEFASASVALCGAYLQLFIKTKAKEQFTSAQRACEHARTFELTQVDALSTLANLYRLSGQELQARELYQQALSLDDAHVDALTGLAALAFRSGDLIEADRLYQQALAAEPGYWRNYHYYGEFLFLSGQYERAIPQFRRVVLLQPDYGPGYNNLGSATYLTGHFDEAIEAWRQALEVAPTASTYSNLGSVYFFSRLFKEAVAMYDMALAMRPEDFIYHANRADALKYIPGEKATSEAGYKAALKLALNHEKINSGDVTLLAQLGRYYAELNRCPESKSYQSRVLSAPSDDPYLYYDLALAQIRCGSQQEVVQSLRRALVLGYPSTLLDRDHQFEPYRDHLTEIHTAL
ncbi:tetratricopeptide repeat protein [Ferrimonas gelatinilytica]|uniref:tetratricopeptide repeat protein n=1 Tax=Ferrimonas gelatinilytica TaxID=1255257 RepID=UPI0031E9599D